MQCSSAGTSFRKCIWRASGSTWRTWRPSRPSRPRRPTRSPRCTQRSTGSALGDAHLCSITKILQGYNLSRAALDLFAIGSTVHRFWSCRRGRCAVRCSSGCSTPTAPQRRAARASRSGRPRGTKPRNPRHFVIIQDGRVCQTLLVRKQCFMDMYSATSTVSHFFWYPDGVVDHFPRVQNGV